MIEEATLVVVIGMLMKRRDVLVEAHRFKRHLGKTFVDNLIIWIDPPHRFVIDLSSDGWSW